MPSADQRLCKWLNQTLSFHSRPQVQGYQLSLCYQEIRIKSSNGRTCNVSRLMGKKLAQLSLKNNIKNVVFDRGPYLYHGRIKALAEGARTGGLEF